MARRAKPGIASPSSAWMPATRPVMEEPVMEEALRIGYGFQCQSDLRSADEKRNVFLGSHLGLPLGACSAFL